MCRISKLETRYLRGQRAVVLWCLVNLVLFAPALDFMAIPEFFAHRPSIASLLHKAGSSEDALGRRGHWRCTEDEPK